MEKRATDKKKVMPRKMKKEVVKHKAYDELYERLDGKQNIDLYCLVRPMD